MGDGMLGGAVGEEVVCFHRCPIVGVGVVVACQRWMVVQRRPALSETTSRNGRILGNNMLKRGRANGLAIGQREVVGWSLPSVGFVSHRSSLSQGTSQQIRRRYEIRNAAHHGFDVAYYRGSGDLLRRHGKRYWWVAEQTTSPRQSRPRPM